MIAIKHGLMKYKHFLNKPTPILVVHCIHESIMIFDWDNYDQLFEFIRSYVIFQVNTYYSEKIYKRKSLINFLRDNSKVRYNLFIGSKIYSEEELSFIEKRSCYQDISYSMGIRSEDPFYHSELYIIKFDRLRAYIK